MVAGLFLLQSQGWGMTEQDRNAMEAMGVESASQGSEEAASRDQAGRFLKGHKGGPGRPRGYKLALSRAFVEDLLEDWHEHGSTAIAATRKTRPHEYLRVIASLVPRDVNLNVNPHEEMTDEQLAERLRALQSTIGPFLDVEGSGGDRSGVGSTQTH